jgi:hypothetical protein
VFRVSLNVGTPPLPRRVMVASDGEVLWVEDGRQAAADGEVFPSNPDKDGEPVEKDLPDIVHPGFWSYYTVNGTHIKVQTTVPERASSFWGGFEDEPFEPDPNPKFAEVNVYYHLSQARAAALAAGVTEAELAPYTPLYFDHWVDAQQNNAWFNPATMTLNFACENYAHPRFPDRPDSPGKHPAYDSSVIYHEYGHWLQKVLSPHHDLGGHFLYLKESQAVQEAVGDAFAALVTRQPKIAAWYFGAGHERDIETQTGKYTDVIPCWTEPRPDGKGKEIHAAAIALSSVIWKAKNTMGEEKALKMLIAAMRMANLPGDFRNMAFALLAADQQQNRGLYGSSLIRLILDNAIVPVAVQLRRAP